ncbi:ATP-binding protein [Spirillospora sp. CA-294931]|uniref:ATP-binding protein n=1 Tax=Spirillospora sp. CA-294931 TaxID=3240042 RepID=UPI003D9044D7
MSPAISQPGAPFTARKHAVQLSASLERCVLGTPAAVGVLRALAEVRLHQWDLSELVGDATVVVSELLTNAVEAAPGRPLVFRLTRQPETLLIEVQDSSVQAARFEQPDEFAEQGRGLWLVDLLASSWGQHQDANGTKTVYAEFKL